MLSGILYYNYLNLFHIYLQLTSKVESLMAFILPETILRKD